MIIGTLLYFLQSRGPIPGAIQREFRGHPPRNLKSKFSRLIITWNPDMFNFHQTRPAILLFFGNYTCSISSKSDLQFRFFWVDSIKSRPMKKFKQIRIGSGEWSAEALLHSYIRLPRAHPCPLSWPHRCQWLHQSPSLPLPTGPACQLSPFDLGGWICFSESRVFIETR